MAVPPLEEIMTPEKALNILLECAWHAPVSKSGYDQGHIETAYATLKGLIK